MEDIIKYQYCNKTFNTTNVVKANQFNINAQINSCKTKNYKENLKTKSLGFFFGK